MSVGQSRNSRPKVYQDEDVVRPSLILSRKERWLVPNPVVMVIYRVPFVLDIDFNWIELGAD